MMTEILLQISRKSSCSIVRLMLWHDNFKLCLLTGILYVTWKTILKSPVQSKTIYIYAIIAKSQIYKLIESYKAFINRVLTKKPQRGDALTTESSHEIHNGHNLKFISYFIIYYFKFYFIL